MRAGWLAKINDIATATPALQVQGSYGEPMPSSRLTGAPGISWGLQDLFGVLKLLLQVCTGKSFIFGQTLKYRNNYAHTILFFQYVYLAPTVKKQNCLL